MIYWANGQNGDGVSTADIFWRMDLNQLRKIVVDDESGRVRISMRGTEAAAVYAARCEEKRRRKKS